MAFYNSVIFPDDISYNSESTLRAETEVLSSDSGSENREALFPYPFHEYDLTYAIKTLDELYSVLSVFHVAKGRMHSFRFKDFVDYSSAEPEDEGAREIPAPSPTDHTIGVGDDYEDSFQLRKVYTYSGVNSTRIITAPVADTVRVAVDGVEQVNDSNTTHPWSLDDSTGIITFDAPPATGEIITAGFEFDVPVRFDVDVFPLTLVYHGIGSADALRLVEVPR